MINSCYPTSRVRGFNSKQVGSELHVCASLMSGCEYEFRGTELFSKGANKKLDGYKNRIVRNKQRINVHQSSNETFLEAFPLFCFKKHFVCSSLLKDATVDFISRISMTSKLKGLLGNRSISLELVMHTTRLSAERSWSVFKVLKNEFAALLKLPDITRITGSFKATAVPQRVTTRKITEIHYLHTTVRKM